MARWQALSPLTVLPATLIPAGETVELDDRSAFILLQKGHIQPAIRTFEFPNIELEEYEHGTDYE